jgi:membrane protease YdiL (CAAX protease family)
MIPPLAAPTTSNARAPLGAGLALGLAAAGLVTNQAIIFAVAAVTDKILWALAAGAVAGVLLPIGVACRLAGRNPLHALHLDRLSRGAIARAVLLVAAGFAPTYALGAWSQKLFPPSPEAFELYQGLVPTGPGSLVFGAIVVMGLAPLAEEILFRGLLLDGLRARLPWGTAIALQAVGFGASHGAMWMLAPITILGVLLGLLRGRSGSLGAAWIAHGLYNGLAYTDLCMTHDVRGARLERWAQEPWVLVPSVVVLGILAYRLGRSADHDTEHPEVGSGDDPFVTR